MFSNGSADVNREPVRLRDVHGHEVHPALHQVGDEGDVPGEAIQLGDNQGGSMEATEPESFLEFGSV